MKFLTATGQSAKGMYDTFKRLADEILFAAHTVDPYLQIAPDAGGTRGGARGDGQGQPVLGQDRTRRSCSCATT